jgi:hypothetical protein
VGWACRTRGEEKISSQLYNANYFLELTAAEIIPKFLQFYEKTEGPFHKYPLLPSNPESGQPYSQYCTFSI